MKSNTLGWTMHRETAADQAKVPTIQDSYSVAERQIRRGRQLVIGGFVVAVIGIIGYCLACFGTDINQEFGALFFEAPGRLVGPALGIIGLGTLLWLIGSFLYLKGAMNGDPDRTDHYF